MVHMEGQGHSQCALVNLPPREVPKKSGSETGPASSFPLVSKALNTCAEQ
jgi:hypothetical protein